MERALKLLQKFVDEHTNRKQRLGLEFEHDFICMCELCCKAREYIKECKRFMKPSGQLGQ